MFGVYISGTIWPDTMDDLPDDIESLLRLSQAGNKQATLHCAFYYESVNDIETANRYYEQAADSGFPEAQFFMGYRLENGIGVPVDLARAGKYYKLSADSGNGDAQFRLSKLLREGKGIEKDEKAADHYFELSKKSHEKMVQDHSQLPEDFESLKALADSDKNPRAMLSVAYHLETSGSFDEANEYYRRSAEHGNAEAQLLMGVRLENGVNVKKDCKEALDFYRESAKNGNRDAQTRIDQIEHPERHLPLIDEKAFAKQRDDVRKLKAFARKGNDTAALKAALMLDADKKYEDANTFMAMSADHGNAVAAFLFGMKLEYGVNIAADVARANTYYEKSAASGNIFAMYRLGMNLMSGSGIEVDLTKANTWIKKSADLGYKSAQLAYAANLETGTGIQANADEAQKYKQMAEKQK